MALIRIELFGSLRITCGERPIASVNTSRLQSLLGYLVLHSGTPVSREQLANSCELLVPADKVGVPPVPRESGH